MMLSHSQAGPHQASSSSGSCRRHRRHQQHQQRVVVQPPSSSPWALHSSNGVAPRTTSMVAQSWKTFGPSQSYSDGDAEYFALTSRLQDQYDLFAPPAQQEEPSPQQEEEPQQPSTSTPSGVEQQRSRRRPEFGLSTKQIQALGLAGQRFNTPDPASLSSRNYLRGDKIDPQDFGYNTLNLGGGAVDARMAGRGRSYGGGARAALGDYQRYPEGRPIFLPEAERYGNPPDLPSLLLQQRVIYISMPFLPSVTELVVAQCYYLDFDDRNRQRPIYVYLNSTGCINEKGQAISADNEFYAIWAALGFTRAPLYTGVTWKAQNQAAVLLSAGAKGHRYSFPHAKISTAPPILNRVFGQTVDAQLQTNELEYATKYYAAILARATGKPLERCQKEYLSRKRYFSVKEAYEEGLIDKLVPGYSLNRFRKLKKDLLGDQEPVYNDTNKPRFKFKREDANA